MAYDISVVVAAPESVTIGGEGPFRVAPLTFHSQGMLQRWLNRTARSPLEMIADRIRDLPPEEQRRLTQKAEAAMVRWSVPEVGTGKFWAAVLDDPDGREEFFQVAMTQEQPIDLDTLKRLYRRLTAEGFVQIRNIALGIDPRAEAEKKGEPPDPAAVRALAEREAAMEDALADAGAALSPWRWITAG